MKQLWITLFLLACAIAVFVLLALDAQHPGGIK